MQTDFEDHATHPISSDRVQKTILFASVIAIRVDKGCWGAAEPHELEALSAALTAIAPVKALWKLTESDQRMLRANNIAPGSNVWLVEWVPQNDLLAHPALKAFLTQGGTNSFLEVRRSAGDLSAVEEAPPRQCMI